MNRCLLFVILFACAGQSFAQSKDSINELRQSYLRKSRTLNAVGTALGLGGVVTAFAGGLMALGNSFDQALRNAPSHPHAPAVLGIVGTAATVAGIVLFTKSQLYKGKAKRLSLEIQPQPSSLPAGRTHTGFQPAGNIFAQGNPHDISISVGIAQEGYGYPNKLPPDIENSGISTIGLCGDYFVNRAFSAGLYAAYTYSFYKYTVSEPNYKNVWKGWDAGVKGTFHSGAFLLQRANIDIYLSAFAGYTGRSLVLDKQFGFPDTSNYNIHTMSAGGIVGLRLPVIKNLTAYGEAGFSRNFFFGGGFSYRFTGKRK